jgi:spermidine synthase
MIYNEMLVHVPMCSHDKVDLNVCLIAGNEDIKKELSYHKNIKVTEIEDESGLAESENEFDIIISTKGVSSVYMNRSLTEKGIAVQPCESLTDTKTFEEAGKLMYINQPYWFFDENYQIKTILFSSKKYHGQADIVRNKSDFIEHTDYYNTDMHLLAFNYPTKIFKEILPSIKI